MGSIPSKSLVKCVPIPNEGMQRCWAYCWISIAVSVSKALENTTCFDRESMPSERYFSTIFNSCSWLSPESMRSPLNRLAKSSEKFREKISQPKES